MSTGISSPSSDISTVVELLQWRANEHPGRRVYSFLADGEDERDHLTFAELERQARVIGAQLQSYGAVGDRALLIYPSGLEFIIAFYACLYSGIIAVPVYPPSAVRSDRALAKFRAIANDAQPALVLTTSSLSSRVEGLLAQTPELRDAHILVTDRSLSATQVLREPALSGKSLAFLQYTSGSTGIPKGVMVSHSNLLHNSRLVAYACNHPADARGVTWLPLYHDLGLIGGVIQPLYMGYESTIMSPAAFLQRPIRWLQAVSRTRATISGGPNFAYDLCVRKITEEQKATLDLSNWQIAANGAEPVRAETLERFATAFASCGFRRDVLYPCYGLAEATLVVSGGTQGTYPTVRMFQEEALEHNTVIEAVSTGKDTRTLVSIGRPLLDLKVVIAHPDTFERCSAGQVGEIWVAGESVAQGYWKRAEESEYTFRAYLADSGDGPFLRTGDLGFIHDGELYITGRLKDLIIIRGSNYYPQDIELTVEQSHPALRPGGVAFAVEVDGEERLVVVQEIERQHLHSNVDEIFASIRRAIAEHHDLQVYVIVLIKPGSIPKTSSGKVQRRATRESYLAHALDVVSQWTFGEETSIQRAIGTPSDSSETVAPPAESKTLMARPKAKEEILTWLVAQIAQRLKVKVGDIDIHLPFAHYGMDSLQAVELSADLEAWLGRSLSPTLAYDYPNIEILAQYLSGETTSTTPVLNEQVERERQNDAIAIIGLGCRFPGGARDPETFWSLLLKGFDGISEVPADRWNVQALYEPDRATPGKMNTRWGGFLDQIDQFDPAFFKISPREAIHMDPQQRLLLEVAWEALEHAGQAPDRLAGSQTGVFIGISSNDYAQLQYKVSQDIDAYVGTGNAHSIAANRLSYVLDLRGPSVAMDTACSSSLVAVHMACHSLLSGECSMAIAGGVNVILSPELTIAFSQARMMSEHGRCRTFDDEADGYVRAEGCGIVVLKPLSQAQQDGDTILAVIRGTAVNQDGRSNGLTAPNGGAQEAVIRQALHNAGVPPDRISYIETHGSSTPLGDPIEFESLKAVLMRERTEDQVCVLGSVKTNIGHLESAAGIAGLIKTVLSLYYGKIPPHLHLKNLNRHISLEHTTFEIPTQTRAWPASKRRYAGVSAFGFGGTNVHVVLEEAPAPLALQKSVSGIGERTHHLLTLSAQSDTALRKLAEQYASFIAAQAPPIPDQLATICFSANTGRSQFAHRLALVTHSSAQLQEQLEHFVTGRQVQGVQHGTFQRPEHPKVAFLFTGQGSQYIGMARELYDSQPTFRRVLDQCDQILRPHLERPLLSVLYPEQGVESPLSETAYTQPALFALEYALVALWQSWGIVPDAVMGHSVGEYVAACVAGMFSLEDGLKLIAERARLMQALPQRGAMAVAFAAPAQIEMVMAPFRQQVAVAALNGPKNTVISGDREAVQELLRLLEDQGITTHRMSVSHAFHSPLMEPMLDDFERAAQQVQFKALSLPLVSNVTGEMLQVGERVDAHYWRQHTRATVQFAAGIRSLVEHGCEMFIELGPSSTLLGMGQRCLPESKAVWLPSLRKERGNWETLLTSVATGYVKGLPVDWQGFDSDYVRHRIHLPTYPFERQRYWLETEKTEEVSASTPPPRPSNGHQRHPLLESHLEIAYPSSVHVWETQLDKQRLPYLNDHRIQGAMALPISAYIEMAQAATVEALGPGPYTLEQIELKKLLLVPEEGAQKVQVVLASEADQPISFHIYSHPMGVPEQPRTPWTLHATGKILQN